MSNNNTGAASVSPADLKNVLALSVSILNDNREAVDQNLINLIREFFNELRSYPTSSQLAVCLLANQKTGVAGDIDIDKLFTGVSNILDVEEKLIGQTGISLQNLLQEISNRPIILAMLARIV